MDLFQYFKEIFPTKEEHIEDWSPVGYNAIRIALDDGSKYVFSIEEISWRIETLDEFIERMKQIVND